MKQRSESYACTCDDRGTPCAACLARAERSCLTCRWMSGPEEKHKYHGCACDNCRTEHKILRDFGPEKLTEHGTARLNELKAVFEEGAGDFCPETFPSAEAAAEALRVLLEKGERT